MAAMSDQWVVMIDPSKEVKKLGGVPLPVEIVSFAYRSTISHIEKLGFTGSLRHREDGSIYITDNGNFIFDLDLGDIRIEFEALDVQLLKIPGVVVTGFFFNMATQVVIGFADGRVETRV